MIKRSLQILILLFVVSLILRKYGVPAVSFIMYLTLFSICLLIILRPVFFKAFPTRIILSVFIILILSILQYWIPLQPFNYIVTGLWLFFMIASYRNLRERKTGFILYLIMTSILFSSVLSNARSFHNLYRPTTYEEYILTKYPEQQGIVADIFINRFKNIDVLASEDYLRMALEADSLKQDMDALQFYNKAIDLNPDNPIAYHRRGFLKLTRLELGPDVAYSAIKDFSRAIRLNHDYADAYYHRSVALSYLGNYGRAILDERKVIELDSALSDDVFYSKYGRSKKSFSVPPHP